MDGLSLVHSAKADVAHDGPLLTLLMSGKERNELSHSLFVVSL